MQSPCIRDDNASEQQSFRPVTVRLDRGSAEPIGRGLGRRLSPGRLGDFAGEDAAAATPQAEQNIEGRIERDILQAIYKADSSAGS